LRVSPVYFTMTISGRDRGHQFRELILPARQTKNNAAILIERQGQTIAFVQAGLFDNSPGDPDREAIPPFRDGRVVWHVDLFRIYISGTWSTPPELA
jgi:hypothetical protein